jgi:hypothetical protein
VNTSDNNTLAVWEGKILRKIFDPVHENDPNIVRVLKSRRMRGAGHVARMGEERGAG